MYQDNNPYAVNSDMFAVDAALSERLAFLRKVYLHVFGAILFLIGLEFLYFSTPMADSIVSLFGLFGGFHVGTIISGAVVALMCGYILYETSLIMHHLPTTAHVAGAMMIFGSIAQLFRHILFLLMRFSDD